MYICTNNKDHYSTRVLAITCESRPPIDLFKKAFNPSCDNGACQKDEESFNFFYGQMLYLNASSTQKTDSPAIKYVAEFFHEFCPDSQAFASLGANGQNFVSLLPKVFPSPFMQLAVEASGCDHVASDKVIGSL